MTATHLFFEIAGHAAALPLAQVAGVHEPSPLFPLAGFSPALKGLASERRRTAAAAALLIVLLVSWSRDLPLLADMLTSGGAAHRFLTLP